MMSDASDMLAAALEQMDGIIAGSKALEYSNGIFDCQSPTSPFMGSLRALHLVEDLRGLLEMMEADEKEGLRCQIPDSTAEALIEWLQSQMTNGHIAGNGDVYQERLARLENDKESLVLQVSVLTDQVEAQGEKIRDLEFCLDEHREKLNATEEMLQQELLSRTSLETQKLNLMAEISNLKLKLTAVGKDRLDCEDRYGDTEGLMQEISELRSRVGEMDNERLQYEKKLKSTKDELASLKEKLEQKEAEVRRLQEKLVCKMKGEGIEISDKDENCKKKLKDKNIEVQKMKRAVESLMAANEEKDRKIEELRQSLNRYKKVQDVVMAQGKKGKEGECEEFLNPGSVSAVLLDMQSLIDQEKSPSPVPVIGSPSHEVFNTSVPEENSLQIHTSILQVSIPAFSPVPKSPEAATEKEKAQPKAEVTSEVSEGKTPGSSVETQPCDSPLASTLQKSSSLGNLKKETSEVDKEPLQKPAETKAPVEGNKCGTLPPKSPSHSGTGEDDRFGTRKARTSFGRGFFKIKNNKRTASAPNLDRSRSASAPTLAETEKGFADHLDLAGLPPRPKETDSGQMSPSSPDSKKKTSGIKKLFGRLKRSQSTTFNPDDMSEAEFKRGGTRATAGPRLGWSRDLGQSNDLDMPFAKWTKEQVCNWLQNQGLGSYMNHGKHWILSGQTLLQASQQDLEKELGIKHPLHRKKLQLALQALGSEEENNHGKLDYNWVTRWLDDIGLPQYKTQFDDGRVDGRMLHYMSVDDLLSLKVVSVLHHLSIKRAIQVLRINNFEPNCLRRRPSDENNITPSEVTEWTNHRVMEWLRSVDLAEYAPNLRGSGVHGGLMVLEPRFNVETLAQLLNIPPNKTLLRRHLATHFNLLVGQDAQRQKLETMESPDYILLTATAKVKPKKIAFSNFGSLRKKKQEDVEEYVCPMELGQASGSGSKKGFKPGMDIRVYDDDDLDRLEQMEDSEGTVRQIGAFSEGINNLTHMLKEDEMFKDFATCSPSASITDEDSNV
nr:liprin-beta-1 isoform X1 [Pelodiscus sinensis]XP_025042829.1 liprin-beta-1 isoform X1 [Pelodiscus sinensis]XP_025042830.1 liprin-beta-1 isoform X1 [Pelodiscus sinensis]XP_025042831.1 liprin-beta-1 isoform X1 [Pelodiscus sinensis]XP_025042832.1 liprin-beta-1 isoform X1 [Pelodiscus sinensis]XP_025042833.1 liprin-beta-1 isoform X1 [Pelodiscus sinensis]XP_025042834.1 liprin-beta-1 isoform X1 [Pelodiscus sinensis]|eukprot:XP_006127752.1 liprin-beta-1 isoform X1 [Pelodiscus sinensis]